MQTGNAFVTFSGYIYTESAQCSYIERDIEHIYIQCRLLDAQFEIHFEVMFNLYSKRELVETNLSYMEVDSTQCY